MSYPVIRHKFTIFLLIVLQLAISCAVISRAAEEARDSSNATRFLQVSKGDFTLYGQRYVMKGFNYFPRTSRHLPMLEWDWREVERDLRRAAGLGANTVRTFVDFYDPVDDPHQLHIEAARTFLRLAEQNGLLVVFSIFENMPGYDIIDAGHHERGYRYVRDFVGALKDEPVIAAWDVLNEGDYLPVNYSEYTSMELVMNFYRAMASEIKKVDEGHLLTAGFAFVGEVHRTASFVDFISFHTYGDARKLPENIGAMLARVHATDLPVVVTETGAPSAGNVWSSESNQALVAADNLETIFSDARLDGALLWQLNDYVAKQNSDGSSAEMSSTEPHYGAFDLKGREKRLAAVARNYFIDTCDLREQQLRLKLSSELAVPLPGDGRFLSGAYSRLRMYAADGSLLREWRFGKSPLMRMERRGWYPAESWGQWAKHEATLAVRWPVGTAKVEVFVQSYMADTTIEAWLDGRSLGMQPVTRVGEAMTSVPTFSLTSSTFEGLELPTQPVGLRSLATSPREVVLAWQPTAGGTCYEVFRGGERLVSTRETSARLAGLRPDTTHQWRVRSVDSLGNRSAFSQPLTVRTEKDLEVGMPPVATIVEMVPIQLKSGERRWFVKWSGGGTVLAEISSDPRFTRGRATERVLTKATYLLLKEKKFVRVRSIWRR